MGALRQISSLGGLSRIPEFLKNCICYYDKDLSSSSDTGTLFIEDKTNITGLNQPNSANKPTITSGGIHFDNSDDYLLFTNTPYFRSNNFTIYFRLNRSVSGDDTLFVGLADSVMNSTWVYMRSTMISFGYASTGVNFTGLNASDLIGDNLYKIAADGTNMHLSINGVEKASLAIPSANMIQFERIGYKDGGYWPLSGDLSQLVIFNKYLNSTQAQLVESQLLTKNNKIKYNRIGILSASLLGQSNAASRAHLGDYPTNIQNFSNSYILNIDTSNYQAVPINSNPTYTGESANDFKGLELTTAFNYGLSFFLKYAIGSTTLAQVANAQNWNTSQAGYVYGLFNNYILKRQYAKQYIQSLGYREDKKAIIWWQGEQDAINQTYANAYEVNLTNFINGVRTIDPNVLFIIMRINYPSGTYRDIIRSAVENVANAMINVKVVDTDSYPLIDTVHVGHQGMINGGQSIVNLINNS